MRGPTATKTVSVELETLLFWQGVSVERVYFVQTLGSTLEVHKFTIPILSRYQGLKG